MFEGELRFGGMNGLTLRSLRWPSDRDGLVALDTSFTSDRVFSLAQTGRTFVLDEITAAPPPRKSYPLAAELNDIRKCDWTQVAFDEANIVVGLAAMSVRAWNRRAELLHLYVTATARGRGVGRALVEAAAQEATRRDARCLWVETQNVNLPAVRFYERLGFHLCGLDTSLYDPNDVGAGEIALFFARDLG